MRPFFLDPPADPEALCGFDEEPGSVDTCDAGNANGCAGANSGADGAADDNGCADGIPCCAAFNFACVVCICFSTVCI